MTRLLALFVILLLPAVAAAQEPRFDVLRGLLKYHGVTTPLDDVPGRGSCADVILVLMGRSLRNPDVELLSRRCLADGGAVLLVSDGPADWTRYLPETPGVVSLTSVGGGPVRCADRENCLDGQPQQPFLMGTPLPLPDVNLVAFGQMQKLATNGAGVLDLPRGNHLLTPVLRFPPGSRDAHGNDVSNQPAVAVLNPALGVGLRGTVVAAADTDMLGNDLMAGPKDGGPPPTDNFTFAFLLTRHLTTAGDRKRTRCFFIENSTIITDFDTVQFAAVPPVTPPVPPIPPLDQLQQKLTDEANRAVGEWQDRDGPSRLLLGDNPAGRIRDILSGLAVVAAVLAGVLLFRAWKSSKLPTDLPRRVPPSLDEPDPTLDRMADDALRSNNLSEPARLHLRGLFAGWGAAGDGELPKVAFQGGGRQELGTALHELWRVAHAPPAAVLTASRWKELRDMIERVSRAADAGRWRFVRNGESA